MTNLIIFSKNRPMQLQATLDSIELHTKGFFNSISVLYRADDNGYEHGYKILRKQKPYVNFVEEQNFQKDLLKLFKYDYTCFLTDDDIVYRDFNKGLYRMFTDDVVCFSLRLGLNVDYCYSNNKPNKIQNCDLVDEFIKWNWRDESLDFGYPLSVTAHIFRTSVIATLSAEVQFSNPNVYEGVLQQLGYKIKPYMVAYQQSKVFGVPANKVNDVNQNRHGLKHSYTTEELNELYLKGKKIDITEIPSITAAQQEIKYVIK